MIVNLKTKSGLWMAWQWFRAPSWRTQNGFQDKIRTFVLSMAAQSSEPEPAQVGHPFAFHFHSHWLAGFELTSPFHSRRRKKSGIPREVHLPPHWRPSGAQCPCLEQQYSHLGRFYRKRKVCASSSSIYSSILLFSFLLSFDLQDSIAQGSLSRLRWLCLATSDQNWQVRYPNTSLSIWSPLIVTHFLCQIRWWSQRHIALRNGKSSMGK